MGVFAPADIVENEGKLGVVTWFSLSSLVYECGWCLGLCWDVVATREIRLG